MKPFFIILCGGEGERLWPLSRRDRPKQFVTFLENKTLLENTFDRVYFICDNREQIAVVTNQMQNEYVKNLIGDKIKYIFSEKNSRNTAPAILFSLLSLKKDIAKDAIVIFLPSDSFVPDFFKYKFYIDRAIERAKYSEKIIILGSMPTRPATGYGYIQIKLNHSLEKISCGEIYDVLKFHEKPDINLAKEYMVQNDMFWNIGVFVAKISVFLKEFQTCCPDVYAQMQDYFAGKIEYSQIKNISMDYAVLEKSKNIMVLPTDFEWYDIGNLEVFLSLQNKYSDKSFVKTINIESENNLAQVHQDKMVVFIGVNDICLVQDKNVILVAKRNEVEKVKKVLNKIKEDKLEEYL